MGHENILKSNRLTAVGAQKSCSSDRVHNMWCHDTFADNIDLCTSDMLLLVLDQRSVRSCLRMSPGSVTTYRLETQTSGVAAWWHCTFEIYDRPDDMAWLSVEAGAQTWPKLAA